MKHISVAMATYNGASYIRRQLESIEGQTLLPSELVICDDGSTDHTIDIVEDFSRSASFPVRIEGNQKRLGYRKNFMKCASLCAEELIAFSDQDDIWTENKLASQVSCFANDPRILLSYHNATLIDAAGNQLGRTFYARTDDTMFDMSNCGLFEFAPGFTQLFRRELIIFSEIMDSTIDIVDPNQTMAHDKWIFFLAMIFGFAHYNAKPLALYRQHGSNTTGAVPDRGAVWKRKFEGRRAEYDRLVAVCENRLDVLRRIQAMVEQTDFGKSTMDSHARLAKAISTYHQSLERVKRRSAIYHCPATFDRLSLLLDAFRNGDYETCNPWAFNRAGLLRDLAMTTFFGGSEGVECH